MNLTYPRELDPRDDEARHIKLNRERCAELVQLTLDRARDDRLRAPARSGMSLPEALDPYYQKLMHVAEHAPR